MTTTIETPVETTADLLATLEVVGDLILRLRSLPGGAGHDVAIWKIEAGTVEGRYWPASYATPTGWTPGGTDQQRRDALRTFAQMRGFEYREDAPTTLADGRRFTGIEAVGRRDGVAVRIWAHVDTDYSPAPAGQVVAA